MLRDLRSGFLSLLLVGIAIGLAACGDDPTGPAAPFSQTDLLVGTGAEAKAGQRLTVHYTLWLYDPTWPESKGRQIQTSVGGPPFTFTLGAGDVIRGWEQGLGGMKVGGRRRLVIPPELAYGSRGSGRDIPPNTTIVFDVELVSVS